MRRLAGATPDRPARTSQVVRFLERFAPMEHRAAKGAPRRVDIRASTVLCRLSWRLLVVAVLVAATWDRALAQQSSSRVSESVTPVRQAVLSGRVLDEETDTPLQGVSVIIAGGSTNLVTDVLGEFSVTLPNGSRVILSLRRLGYRGITHVLEVRGGDTTRLTFFLARVVATLDTVTVLAELERTSPRLRGFESRRRQHIGGTFLTRTYIERRRPVRTVDLLRALIGVRVIDSAGVMLVASSRGARALSLPSGKVDTPPLLHDDCRRRPAKGWGLQRRRDSA